MAVPELHMCGVKQRIYPERLRWLHRDVSNAPIIRRLSLGLCLALAERNGKLTLLSLKAPSFRSKDSISGVVFPILPLKTRKRPSLAKPKPKSLHKTRSFYKSITKIDPTSGYKTSPSNFKGLKSYRVCSLTTTELG